jgi:hypothetical protein
VDRRTIHGRNPKPVTDDYLKILTRNLHQTPSDFDTPSVFFSQLSHKKTPSFRGGVFVIYPRDVIGVID